MKNRIMQFLKSETVLIIATILAIVSSFIVTPSLEYIDYIDFRTILLLWSLMMVVQGYKEAGLFEKMTQAFTKKMSDTRIMALILVMSCFFLAMFITNDVALITFVPFSLILLKKTKKENLIIPVIVLQTIAANLGSILTPIGNPQNLYLYTKSGMSLAEFEKIVLPYGIISLVVLAVTSILFIKKEEITEITSEEVELDKTKILINTILFIVSLLCVVRIIDYKIAFIIVLIVELIIDRKLIKKVDYSLLLTFIAFFIFIGNIKNISSVQALLEEVIAKKEVMISVLLSQIISNVPAAILLSNFTDNIKGLIIGTNIGGLGTIIASMASLISYKLIAKENCVNNTKYIVNFTVFNVQFLIILLVYSVLF